MVDSSSDERIKAAFRRVKEHIGALEGEIKANRNFIIEQNKQIKQQNGHILSLLDQIRALEALKQQFNSQKWSKSDENTAPEQEIGSKKPKNDLILSLKNEYSNGNKGVSLDGYSLNGYSLPGYSLDIHRLKDELPGILRKLSRQEFLTFLTVYQQEEQDGKVTYQSVAKQLNISAGCVRTYVSGLIRKGLPVVKSKYNNKLIILTIPSEIRGLNMKKKLIQIFYNQDPNQTKLGESS